MDTSKLNIKLGWIIAIIIVAALCRFINPFIPALSNFTPIGAMALFGAAYFSKKHLAFVIPLVAMFLSDLVLNNVVYAGMYPEYYSAFTLVGNEWVYLSFGLIILLGFVVLKKVKPLNVLGAAIGASIIFFIISNFGVWITGLMYPKTFSGLIECYIAAIPFFGNTLAGNILYTTVFFGVFEYMKRAYPQTVLAR